MPFFKYRTGIPLETCETHRQLLKSFNCSASTGRPMRPPAASVIIWHTSIFSFLSLARIVGFITSAKKARKVTGLPKKRLEKSICSVTMGSSWSSGVPVPWGHGVPLQKDFARIRSTVDFGRGGNVDCEAKFGAGGFLEVLSSLQAWA